MDRIRIALFNGRAAAEPIRNRLVQAGIPAEIHEELRLARLWFVSKPAGGARLEVPSSCSERSNQLLLDWDAAHRVLGEAIHCPECGSLHVDYPQFTRKSFLTNVAMGLMSALGLVEKNYYCENCHCMWEKPGKRPRHERDHMAPNYFVEGLEQTALPATQHQKARAEEHASRNYK